MHTYTSSRAKRKRFYRKSGFQMFFVDFGRHGGAPKWCTNRKGSKLETVRRNQRNLVESWNSVHACLQTLQPVLCRSVIPSIRHQEMVGAVY